MCKPAAEILDCYCYFASSSVVINSSCVPAHCFCCCCINRPQKLVLAFCFSQCVPLVYRCHSLQVNSTEMKDVLHTSCPSLWQELSYLKSSPLPMRHSVCVCLTFLTFSIILTYFFCSCCKYSWFTVTLIMWLPIYVGVLICFCSYRNFILGPTHWVIYLINDTL